ncbi:uncharacterized protein LOC143230314 [Tachypleus tridentatus]|uniref:uncharacterized protein LOC143230314 n=1 Tax=Tachypleus tridentatus TaxID=6853 RepID=UPI003FCF812F
MKCVHLSGAQKRKLAKKNQQKALFVVAKTGKLTNFFTQLTQYDLSNQNPSLQSVVTCTASDSDKIEVEASSTPISTTLSTSRSKYHDDVEVSQAGSIGTSLTNDLNLPVNSPDISSVNVDACCSTRQCEVGITAENENLLDYGKMLQSTKDEETKAKDPEFWLNFSADDVAYWIVCGPTK